MAMWKRAQETVSQSQNQGAAEQLKRHQRQQSSYEAKAAIEAELIRHQGLFGDQTEAELKRAQALKGQPMSPWMKRKNRVYLKQQEQRGREQGWR